MIKYLKYFLYSFHLGMMNFLTRFVAKFVLPILEADIGIDEVWLVHHQRTEIEDDCVLRQDFGFGRVPEPVQSLRPDDI